MGAQQQLLDKAEQQTHKLLRQAADHFDIPCPKVTVRFDLRGTAAGQARMQSKRRLEIRYNAQLLAENPESFLARTVPHEAAHVVAYCLHGSRIKPHGAEWKMIMALFQADPSRCHSYDVTTSQQRTMRRFTYRCSCRDHELSTIRHNRIQRGQVYHCLHCKEPLQPASSD